MSDLQCPFRSSVQNVGVRDTAVCGMLEKILGDAVDVENCRVDREACVACLEWFEDRPLLGNPTLASLVFSRCTDVEERAAEELEERLQEVMEEAELRLSGGDLERVPPIYACDVIVCCHEATDQPAMSIQSVLDQDDVMSILHIVCDGGDIENLLQRFAGQTNVVIHRNEKRLGLYASLHKIVPFCQTPFIAIQHIATISRLGRLRRSLRILDDTGGEILSAGVANHGIDITPKTPDAHYTRYAPPESLVFRRATFVDMGGFANRADADAEWMFRARAEGRKVVLVPDVLVDFMGERTLPSLGPRPEYRTNVSVLREHAQGYPLERVASDVVLPFFGKLHYAEEALQSVLEQEDVDCIVHLVDDASDFDTHSFFNPLEWTPASAVVPKRA
jgi:hypothetical protein